MENCEKLDLIRIIRIYKSFSAGLWYAELKKNPNNKRKNKPNQNNKKANQPKPGIWSLSGKANGIKKPEKSFKVFLNCSDSNNKEGGRVCPISKIYLLIT